MRDVKGMTRVLKHAVEENHGVTIKQDHPILAWMVRHAAAMMAIGRRGADGRTAHELRKGKPFRRKLVPFGEIVYFLPVGKRQSRLVDRWLPGLFLGLRGNSDEYMVGVETGGVLRARSVRRLSEEQRADPGLVGKLKGVPWLPIPGGEEGADAPPALVKIVADKVVPDDQLPPAPAPLRIQQAAASTFGGMLSCSGTAIPRVARAAWQRHSDWRRERTTAIAESASASSWPRSPRGRSA